MVVTQVSSAAAPVGRREGAGRVASGRRRRRGGICEMACTMSEDAGGWVCSGSSSTRDTVSVALSPTSQLVRWRW